MLAEIRSEYSPPLPCIPPHYERRQREAALAGRAPPLPVSGRLLIVVLSFVIIGDVSCAGGESPSSLHQMKGTSSLPLITSLSCPPLFLILCPRSCSSSPPVLVKKKKRRARQNSVQNSATAGSLIIILAAAPLYLHVQMY